jgi:ribonuclease T1
VSSGRRISIALVGLVLLAVVGWIVKGAAGGSPPPGPPASGTVSRSTETPLSSLPPQAATTYRLVLAGGPFPYPHNDGVVFDNRERRLPTEKSGYYHEYTVPTPGSHDRGARRLITGSDRELYYTGDHYSTFVAVDPGR